MSSLVACRFNPNHRMKPSKREIHEQKCPDRFKIKKKLVYCPYDPLELIDEKELEEHKKICKNRPRITEKEEKEIENAKKLNDIATEKEQIQYARQKYYKGCVEEHEIEGLGNQKQQKKKANKKLKAKFAELNEKEANEFIKHVDNTDNNDSSGENENHNIDNFAGDENFDLGNEKDTEEKSKKPGKKNKDEKKDVKINEKKEEIKNKNIFINNRQNKGSSFYKYDPNDEDKDIGKYSANIIVPNTIYEILGIVK